jgi:hypothetical protein
MKILEQALNKINSIHKKQKDFLATMVYAMIGSSGKKNMRNLARYAKITEHTFARQMAKTFDFIRLNFEMIKSYATKSALLMAVQDTSFASKSGKHSSGLGWFWNGCAGKVEKGQEVDVISIVKVCKEKNEAFTLSAQQTPAKTKAKSTKVKTDLPEKNRVDFALDHVKKTINFLLDLGIKYMAADSLYANTKYVNGIVALGLHLVSKIRKDTRFLKPYTGQQKSRGRKRITTNEKITQADFSIATTIKEKGEDVELRDCIAHCVAFGRKIKVVSVKKIIGTKEAEIFLFSTDLELNALQIYKFYVARFQIEFIFRDAKGFTGLADCQSRNAKRINFHFNASLLALNIARLQEYEAQKVEQVVKPFSMTSIARKYHVEIVVNRIFSMLQIDLTSIKLHPDFKKVLSFGAIVS